ncbi:MAG: hypothetical protein U0694_07650 [Anaerolineae bacterium]
MWVGSIRVRVRTKAASTASTDSPVIAAIMRDTIALYAFFLNPEFRTFARPNLEISSGTDRDFFQYSLPKSSDSPVPDEPGGQPPYGLEFGSGLAEHCTLKLRIFGNDLWITDEVELLIRELHPVHLPETSKAFTWVEETNWKSVGLWSKDIRISSDTSEGFAIVNFNVK